MFANTKISFGKNYLTIQKICGSLIEITRREVCVWILSGLKNKRKKEAFFSTSLFCVLSFLSGPDKVQTQLRNSSRGLIISIGGNFSTFTVVSYARNMKKLH